jgi:hypothetical protein
LAPVAGAVAENAVRFIASTSSAEYRREPRHVTTGSDQVSQNIALDAEIIRHHLEARRFFEG